MKRNVICGLGFMAKVLKGFFDEIEKADEENEAERRHLRRHHFGDMDSIYSGFGDRYEDDDDEEAD